MPLLVLALGAALLAGCTNEATPVPASTSPAAATSTPTPSPTPTPVQPPAPPAAMATNDEAGAVAAAQYFMTDLYDYMFESGDVEQWSALADDGCNFCNSMLDVVEEMNAARSTETSEPTVVESVESTTLVDGSRYSVNLTARQGVSQRINSAGESVSTSDGGRFSLNFAIAWDNGWSILAVDATPLAEASS